MKEWIGQIQPASVEVEQKVRVKHHITTAQIKQAVSCGAEDWGGWHTHPVYGRRLILVGSDTLGPMIVYLRPIDRRDGLWEYLTAWRTT
jgi:hypothetical protein